MSIQLFANNATTTLSSPITNVDLTITVADGSAMPSPAAGQYFLVTIEVGAAREVIAITSRSGNSLTVLAGGRGQEGTAASPWGAGATVAVRVTKNTLQRFARHEDLLDSYAGTIFNPSTNLPLANSILFAASDGRFKGDNTNLSYNPTGTLLTITNATVTTLLKVPTIDTGGVGNLAIKTNSGTQQFGVNHVTSAANYMTVSGAVTTAGPLLATVGSDTNVDLNVTLKGTGVFKLNTAYAFNGVVSPAQITATQNDYTPTSAAVAGAGNIFRVSTDALRTITGLSGGVTGRVVTFINVGAFGISFTSQDAGSTATNRFSLNTPSIIVPPNGAISFWYDITTTRWRGIGTPSSSVDVIQTVADAATINWDTSLGAWGNLTLGASGHTMATPTGLVDGKEYVLFITQGGGAPFTMTWSSAFKWPLGAAPTLSAGAAAVDMFSFKARSGNLYGGMLKGMA